MRHWLALAIIVLALNIGHAVADGVKTSPAAIGLAGARAGRWINGTSSLSNSGNKPRLVRMAMRIKAEPGLEFQRTVLVPAHAAIRYGFPLLCPRDIQRKGSIAISSWRVGTEPRKVRAGDLFVDSSRMPTAAILDAADHGTASLVSGMRTLIGYKPRISYAAATRLPFWAAGYDGLSAMVLSLKSPRLTPSQISAIQQWTAGGGNLWIQVNRTPTEFCRALLKSSWRVVVAGRGRVATLHITAAGVNRTVHLTHSISLCYLMVRKMKVLEWVNGWPAVAVCHMGKGRIFVCAMNGRGLLKADGKAGSVLWPVAREFYKAASRLSMAPVRDMAQGAIGYHIESRRTVGMVLIGLLIVLMGGAIWARRRHHMEWIVAILLGGVVCAGALLFVLGRMERGRVGLTSSAAQVARIIPAMNKMVISGVSANFSPGQITSGLTVQPSAWLGSPRTLEQQNRLIIQCGGSGAMRLQNLRLASGAPVQLQYRAVMPETSLRPVYGHFGAAGLKINAAPLVSAGMKDISLAAPMGLLAVRNVAATRLVFKDASILPRGQYLAAGLLTGTQKSLAAVYRSIVRGGIESPVILCQTGAWAPPVKLSGEPIRYTRTVVEMPVGLRPQRSGGRVHIPWPFLPFHLVRGPRQRAVSTVYEAQRHRWIQHISRGARIYINFQLPASERDLQLTQARLMVRLSAAGRPLTIRVRTRNGWVPAERMASPAQRLTVVLHGRTAPQCGPNGGVDVELRIGGGDSLAKSWEMQSVRLAVDGTEP